MGRPAGWMQELTGRGAMQRASMPQGLWHFEQAAREARVLSGSARERFNSLSERLGGQAMMQVGLVRPMVRKDYVLVLG